MIRNKLHGTARSDLRRTINRHVARREMLRELGKTRRVLKSILGNLGGRKHQDPLFLGAVRQSDTPVICTPAEVHNALTSHFKDWYDMPPQYSSDSLHSGNWTAVFSSFDHFYSAVRHTNFPKDLCNLIYRAIQHTPGRINALNKLTQIFSAPPSFDEFVNHISHLSNNSAPGMSGCSYNMMKSWPEPAQRAAYDWMAKFWSSKHVAPHWQWRWLIPIPKKLQTPP